MAGIFGHITKDDRDRVFTSTLGQRVFYEAAMEWIQDRQAELDQAMGVLVERTTEDHKLRYKLPGTGYLQKINTDGRYQSVKAQGQWDVAFPLEDFGAQVSGSDVNFRYMRVEDLARHLMTVASMNISTTRYLILKALFTNTQKSFVDDDWGTLLVEPLANGDATLYPPIPGTDDEAVEDHYLVSGYAASAISATNNPILTLRDEIIEHYGDMPSGTNVAAFIHPDQEAKIAAISGYVAVSDFAITYGQDSDILQGLGRPHPGVLIGRINGVWIVKWRWIPTNYIAANDLDMPAPLIKRVDPADTGIPEGLHLVAEDEEFPFKGSFWRNRMGYGTGNRLCGAVMFLDAGGSYTIPTAYQ